MLIRRKAEIKNNNNIRRGLKQWTFSLPPRRRRSKEISSARQSCALDKNVFERKLYDKEEYNECTSKRHTTTNIYYYPVAHGHVTTSRTAGARIGCTRRPHPRFNIESRKEKPTCGQMPLLSDKKKRIVLHGLCILDVKAHLKLPVRYVNSTR